MKYSFILPYYNRKDQFMYTLNRMSELYGQRTDYEIIVSESFNNYNNQYFHDQLLECISFAKSLGINIIHLFSGRNNGFNPAILFNEAAKIASGEFLIISNPEIAHTNDVLSELDFLFDIKNDFYVIMACAEATMSSEPVILSWYQHSNHRNCCYHFCSAISKSQYLSIGGFDEEYAKGIAYDDNDFINNIAYHKIPIVIDDSILTLHLLHNRDYQADQNLCKINELYYLSKWGDFIREYKSPINSYHSRKIQSRICHITSDRTFGAYKVIDNRDSSFLYFFAYPEQYKNDNNYKIEIEIISVDKYLSEINQTKS